MVGFGGKDAFNGLGRLLHGNAITNPGYTPGKARRLHHIHSNIYIQMAHG